MNLRIARQEARTSLRFLLLLALGLMAFGALMTGIYPSIKDSMQNMLKMLPSFLKPMVASQMGFNTVEGFLSIAFTHPASLALFSAWAITHGSSAVAGEIEQGTLGWMLSYPVGRVSFLLSKLAVLWLGVLVLVSAFVGALWVTLGVQHIAHAPLHVYLVTAGMTGLLYGALGTLTLWCSAAVSERGKAAVVGAAVLLLSYLLNYLAQLWSPAKVVRFLSLFAYYDPKALLYGNAAEPRDLLVLGGVLVISAVGAALTFRRRSLAI